MDWGDFFAGMAVVISLLSAGISVWAVRRDHPRLKLVLTTGAIADGSGDQIVILRVENPGRYDEYVENIGLQLKSDDCRTELFAWKWPNRRLSGTFEFVHSKWTYGLLPGPVPAGQSRSVVIPQAAFMLSIKGHAGRDFAGMYAGTSSGRRYFDRAPTWLRELRQPGGPA